MITEHSQERAKWQVMVRAGGFLLLLIAEQIRDLAGFGLTHGWRISKRWPRQWLLKISWRARKETGPTSVRWVWWDWLPTALLTVLIAVWLGRIGMSLGQQWGRAEAEETLLQAHSPVIIEELIQFPPEIKIASVAAVVNLTLPEMAAVWQQAQALSPKEQALLTQAETLNLALISYYLGEDEQYQWWLEQARAMDSGEDFFRL